MSIATIMGLLTAIQHLSGIVDGWRQSQGMTKQQLVALARQKDAQLASFIETELAMLDAKANKPK